MAIGRSSAPGGLMAAPPSGTLFGMALTAGGYATFALQDAAVKWLATSYGVPQILFLRSVVIVAIALAFGRGPVLKALARSRNKGAILGRAVLILTAWLLFYSASRSLGLAEMTTLYFAAPVMAVALAALLLRERVGRGRWLVALLGFAGVLVAAGPMHGLAAGGALGPAGAVLLAALCWACASVLVRWIGRTDSTLTQMLASNLLFSLACLPTLPWTWTAPDAFGLTLMLALGVSGGLGQALLFEGFRHAPASAVAPIEYTGLVWAFLYGYAIWADVPPPHVFAGAALIAVSSLILVGLERRRAADTRRASGASAAAPGLKGERP